MKKILDLINTLKSYLSDIGLTIGDGTFVKKSEI